MEKAGAVKPSSEVKQDQAKPSKKQEGSKLKIKVATSLKRQITEDALKAVRL